MAKIVLVSKKVSTTAWQLALALKAQQHDVVFLTSYGESVDDSRNIEFMAYFKKWNFLEALKIIPGLFGLQAQILHLLLEEEKLNPAQALLATFAKAHPQCILTTSLLNVRKSLHRRNLLRFLIEESDIITCPTVESLGELRGLSIRVRRQGRGVLPPVLNLFEQQTRKSEEDEFQKSEGEQKLTHFLNEKKYIVVPFNESSFSPESDFFNRIQILAQNYTLLFWGTHSHWSLRSRKNFEKWMAQNAKAKDWLITGDKISQHTVKSILFHSEAFLLAGLNLSSIELTEYYLKAIQNNCTLILDSLQSSVHGTLWRTGINCWVLAQNKINTELVQLLTRPRLKIPTDLTQQMAQERQWLDYPMNELNRLYNRALDQKP